jgi:Flp pilus assembly protein TadD
MALNFESESSNFKSARRRYSAMRALHVAFWCGSLCSLAGCQTPTHAQAKVQAEQRWSQVRGQVKLQLARQQFERGLFEDSIKTLQEATTLDSTSADAYAMLAKANLELGKSTTAEQVLTAAEKMGLTSADLHYFRGVVLEQRNELDAALSQYVKACSLDATRVEYLLARIETLVALNRTQEALALADSSANQFDDDASIALLGARIAALTGDDKGALERFQNPSIQNAGSRVATEELGTLLATQGRCSETIRILQPLCDSSAKELDAPAVSAQARRTLAECYLTENQPKLAIGVLYDHAVANPADKASQLLLAKAGLAAGEYMTALQALEQAGRGSRSSPEVELLLATTHWKRNDLGSAESVLDQVLTTYPGDVDAWCLRGELLLELGRREEARSAFERATQIDPECGWAAKHLKASGSDFWHPESAEKKITKRS